MVLQFHEEQRQAIDEADDVSSAMIEGSIDPHLAHTEEVVLLRRSEVNDLGTYLFGFAIGLDARHGHTILDVLILLLIDLHQRLAAHVLGHALHTFLQLLVGQPRVQRLQCLAETTCQQDLMIGAAP